ncbi:MAG: sigma-70 family RNA polymerase sigma factor [Planctomycetes bacterium]|nr:sigma-70 family RNA polymerase sigma factor [Planctomycetota bacterium]
MTPDRREMLETLVRQHARAVGAICWARIGRALEVDDLVQETMMRACRDFGALREPEKFGAWVRGIAENVCREWFRGKKRFPKALGDAAEDVPEPEREVPAGEEERVRRALGEMPEIYRETIALFHFEKRSYAQIGAMLGVSAAAVNARLTKGRAMLRARLKGVTADDMR